MTPDITSMCSDFFNYEMLFHCGETWGRCHCDNHPKQQASWQAYADLARQILDPLTAQFGQPELTFGFCGDALRRLIYTNPQPHIAPKLDQHAAHELNRQGSPICPRGGAAVDLRCTNQNSHVLALWIAQYLPFDRIYLYGTNRPLHVSFGPERCSQIVWLPEHNGRRIPRCITHSQLESLVTLEAAC